MIHIPLSQISSQDDFDAAVIAHRAALEKHMKGKPGIAAPTADPLVQSVIARVPQTGPVAKRGPDSFVIQPYEIIDDTPPTPKSAEQELALSVLRETIQ